MTQPGSTDPTALLLRPEAYPHPVERVVRLETHISWVFLTGTRAYKVKRPVDLGFLDFSTLALRRAACEEELRLNRRLAPDLYLGMAALVGPESEPRWVDAESPQARGAREYAIVMREFPQRDQLDRRFAAGDLHPRELVALARTVSDFHASLPAAGAGSPWGTFDHVVAPMRENFDQIERRLTDDACRAPLRSLREWTEDEAERLRPYLEARRADGRVRECHGDLHLANLVLLDERVVPFDCIEFSPALRWMDVVSDAAFLAMDLESRGAGDLAHVFASAYFETGGDYDGVRLFPFYVVYRSMVRAKVAAIAYAQGGMTDAAALDRYRMHVRTASVAAHERRPALLLTHGVSASGKSWLSSRLVGPLRGIRVRSDVERKRLHGLPLHQPHDPAFERELYGPEATTATYERLRQAARSILEAGYPAIVDATFLRPDARKRFIALAEELQVRWGIVACSASPAVLRDRIERRIAARSDVSDADLPVLDGQIADLAPLTVRERARTIVVDTDGPVDFDDVEARLRDLLATS